MTKVKSTRKKASSVHSRAARRATSPGIDTDKSLKAVKLPPESANSRPAVLAHHGGGITKKAKHGRKSVLTFKARRRKDKAMDKAEAVVEKTMNKIQRSKGQSMVIQSRKKTWDEVNKRLAASGDAKLKGTEAAPPADERAESPGTEDEEMDSAEMDMDAAPKESSHVVPAEMMAAEDEIL